MSREPESSSTPNIAHTRRSRIQRFSSEFATKEYDFSDTKMTSTNAQAPIKQLRHDKNLLEKYKEPCPEALVESAIYNVKLFEDNDFYNFKLSVKCVSKNDN